MPQFFHSASLTYYPLIRGTCAPISSVTLTCPLCCTGSTGWPIVFNLHCSSLQTLWFKCVLSFHLFSYFTCIFAANSREPGCSREALRPVCTCCCKIPLFASYTSGMCYLESPAKTKHISNELSTIGYGHWLFAIETHLSKYYMLYYCPQQSGCDWCSNYLVPLWLLIRGVHFWGN